MSNIIDLPSCVLCQVPEGSINHHHYVSEDEHQLWMLLHSGEPFCISLPPGNYGTPFLASEKEIFNIICLANDLNPSTTVVIPKI